MKHRFAHLTLCCALLPGCMQISIASESRYFYDDLSRLVRVERPEGVVVTYTYDAVGNRLSKTVIHDRDFDDFADSLDNCPDTPNDQTNTDGDPAGDACDCAPTDSGAFAVPAEVMDLSFAADGVTLNWTSAIPGSGSATVHDVFRGSVSELPVGDKPSETCLPAVGGASTGTDSTDPAVGEASWYLVRGRNVCGTGTYGTASDLTPRTSAVCP